MRIILTLVAVLVLLSAPTLAQEFTDVSKSAGAADDGLGKGVAFADVDNDSFVYSYVSNKGGSNWLYLNNGKGTFTDMTASAGAGIAAPGFTMGSVFGDYDNDGELDIYCAHYGVGAKNVLIKNNGTGTFTDVAGVGDKSLSWMGVWSDIDNGGDIDLYEGDCRLANQLYLNDGQGTLTNVADTQPQLQCTTVRTKGTAFADVDNDGVLEL